MIIRISLISVFLLSCPTLSAYPTALNCTTTQARLLAELANVGGQGNTEFVNLNTTVTELPTEITSRLTNPTFAKFKGTTGVGKHLLDYDKK